MRYQEILEACWKGYRQAGMKEKGDRMVPNCVPVSEQEMEEDLRKWFKEKWVRFGPDGKIRGDCARGSSKEGKPKCLPQAKAHALGKKGRASAAAKKRREDPNPERRGAAKNVATRVREDDSKIDKVFKGHRIEVEYPEGRGRSHIYHRQMPMDLKGIFSDANSVAARNPRATINLFVNDEYIPNYEWQDGVEMPPQGIGEAMTDYQKRRQRERDVDMGKPVRPLPKNPKTDYQKRREQERRDMELGENQLDEKQDACYRKVKSRYKVWPSAYASGALVQCRKKGAANWGTGGKKK
jgi:hypothetical protein